MISILKLINGEEIIAKIADHDSVNYLLEDPVQIYRNVAPNGMTWIQCSHWLLFNKSSLVEIEKNKVLAVISDPNDNVIRNYNNFVSGGWEEHQKQMRDEQQEYLKKVAEEQTKQFFGKNDKETIH